MEKELKTAAAYIRVSTDRQTELSPDSQLRIIKEYAKQNGYNIPSEYIFREDGLSGKYVKKRPQFIEMIGLAKQSLHRLVQYLCGSSVDLHGIKKKALYINLCLKRMMFR